MNDTDGFLAQEARLLAALTAIKTRLGDAKPGAEAALRADLEAARAEASDSAGVRAEAETLRQEVARLKEDLAGAEAGHAETVAELRAELARASAAPAPIPTATPAPEPEAPSAPDLALIEELRLAAQAGVSDADLINRALEAELQALKEARAEDLAELKALVAELDPILQESAHA